MKLRLPLMFIALVLMISCSDVKDDITQPAEVSIHKAGFADPSSPDFHKYVFANSGWEKTTQFCQQCHGADYSGGTTGTSCLTCHSSDNGPESCNTCHGSFANANRIAPPRDLSGNTSTSNKGVGAHTAHVYEMTLSENIGCYECHEANIKPGVEYVFAHQGPSPAELKLGDLASLNNSSPSYDYSTLECSNVYCHGNFTFSKSESSNSWAYTDSVITGESFSPIWNKVDGTQGACGTCHMLPPMGHINAGTDSLATSCSGCHNTVVDSEGNIIDRAKHINGAPNVFGN